MPPQSLALVRTLHQAVLAAAPYEAPPPLALALIKGGPGATSGGGSLTASARNLSNGGLSNSAGGAATGPAAARVATAHGHGRSASRESLDILEGGTPGAVAANGRGARQRWAVLVYGGLLVSWGGRHGVT